LDNIKYATSVIEELPTLETVCDGCNGRGGYTDRECENDWAHCPYCGGSGFKPTPIGARILELIRHNSKVKVTAELSVSSVR
jgi:DnaJ-class molecular chaperone